VLSSQVDDDAVGSSSGDGDGKADAGETIELRVTLRNGGGAQATGVNATLPAADPEGSLTILQNTVSYGTIGAGGASQGTGAFVISISPTAPVAYQPILTVTATGAQESWADVLPLPLRRPYLEHYSHVVDDAVPRGNGNGIVESGEEIWYRVRLRNAGQDRATAVTGILRALEIPDHNPHPLVTVDDSTSTFGTILQGGQVEGDRFAFTLDLAADPSTLLLQLTLNDALGQADVQFIDVDQPVPTDSLTTFGDPTLIRVKWIASASGDTKGYDIERSSNPGGPFTRINNYTVDGTAAYEDRNLPPLTRFYYRVVTRDLSYNASMPSETISGTTNPPYAAGWPLELGQQSTSSPMIADIDGGPHTEILTGAEMQYAWHGDGTEVVNGDGDDRYSGPFSLWGRRLSGVGFAAIPAVGDVNGDGDFEVANIGFTAESVYVWDHQGILTNGWPKWVHNDFNWASVALPDLDYNNDLEIVAWAGKGGRLFAWHHNGQELVDGDNDPSTDGVLAHITANSPNFNYGSPAIGNLDGDAQLEIVVTVNKSTNNSGGVYAFNINGSPVPGWPFFTGDGGTISSEVSSSPAIGDLDGNGTEEVVFACERMGGSVYVLNRNGTVFAGSPGWPRAVTAATQTARIPSPVLADLNEDGNLDIIYIDTSGALWAWNYQGAALPGFPVSWAPFSTNQRTQSTPAIGDFDATPGLEIVFGDESGKIHAYNHDATLANGFPIQTNGEVRGTPALWDLDRDNLLELAVVSFDYNVYVWDLPVDFKPSRLPWPFFRHDTKNTGRVITPTQVGIEDPGSAPGAVTTAAFHPVTPNPFNPFARLAFDVPGETTGARPVKLEIYDVNGRLVRRLINGQVGTGRHSTTWDGRGTDGRFSASGVYFAKIEIGNFVATQKMTMLR